MRHILMTGLILAPITGCSKPAVTSGDSKSPVKPVESKTPAVPVASDPASSLATAKADFKFTPQEWYDECKNNPNAKAKYKDKIIELVGVVDAVYDQPYPPLSIITFDVKGSGLGLRAACSPADLWKKVFPNSKTVVRGYWDRLDGELFPCIVVNTDGKAESYKAVDLAAEVLKDKDVASDKFAKRWCWVEGKILKIIDETNDILLYIEGSGGMNIECRIMRSKKKEFDALNLKPGQTVRAFGQINVIVGPIINQISMMDTRFE